MPDCATTTMRIGGNPQSPVDAKALLALLNAATGLDHTEIPLDDDVEWPGYGLTTDGHILIRAHDQPRGMFADLEVFCEQHELPYDTDQEGNDSWPATTTRWRPGPSRHGQRWSLDSVAGDNAGAPYIEVALVRGALAQGYLTSYLDLVWPQLPPMPPLTFRSVSAAEEEPHGCR